MIKKLLTAKLLFLFLLTGAGLLKAQTMQEGIKATERMEMDKAKGIFNSILSKEPNNAQAYYQLGTIYILNDNNDSATFYYQKAISANGNDPFGYVGMGRVLLKQAKASDARQNFEKALSLSANKNAYVMQQIADGYVDALDFKDAEYALNLALKARDMDKKNPNFIITAGDAYRLNGEGGKGQLEYQSAQDNFKNFPLAALRLGEFFMKLKNMQAAEEKLNQAKAIDSTYPPVYKAFGEFYYKKNQVDKAIASYKKFLSLVGTSPDERIRYASFLFLTKNYKDALAELEKVEPRAPDNQLLLRLMGYLYYETGNFPKGLEKMERYFKLMKPENTIAKDYEYYGKLLAKNGKDSLAIQTLNNVIAKDTTMTDLYDEIASVYAKGKKYNEAARTIETKMAKTKSSLNTQDYFTLGRYYYSAEKYVNADSAFSKVIKYFPTWPPGYLYRARTNSRLDPKSEKGMAKPYYEQFIEKAKPDAAKYKKELAEAYYYLGYYNFLQKDNKTSLENLDKVLEYDPGNKEAQELIKFIKAPKPQQKK